MSVTRKLGFEIVKSKEQMEIFKKIWLQVCDEETFESEEFHTEETATHILYLNDQGEYIGTAEVGLYVPNEKSTVQYYYDFSKLSHVKENMGKVYEIDKVCILSEQRDIRLLKTLVYSLLTHYKLNHAACYVSAMESTFYHIMKRRFKVPLMEVEEKEKRKQKFNDFYLYPLHLDLSPYVEYLTNAANSIIDLELLDSVVGELQESLTY
ncbi:hypothetical protein U8V72_15305 [Priestia filamentosa]|uniref:hypothetical protein n=1 Tax=Priestia filamentosa TaxID=1402861 RepID=UPI0005895951